MREPLAAVVVELPIRRAGYCVPPWDELAAIAAYARSAGAAFHLDGARPRAMRSSSTSTASTPRCSLRATPSRNRAV